MANPPPDLVDLGRRLLEHGPVKTLSSAGRRIRVLFNGAYVADSTDALFVWEHPYYPFYYLPASSFAPGTLVRRRPPSSPAAPPYSTADLRVGGRATDRVLVFSDEFGAAGEADGARQLAGRVRVEFGAADGWFEEDTQIYVHPRDPFRRVDVLASARPLAVRVAGRLVVPPTTAAHHLYETGLPCRYYVPPTAVDRAVLRNSATTTACPYKGVANYYHVEVEGGGEGEEGEEKEQAKATKTFQDLVWYYKTPTLESAPIAGHLCFYHEREGVEIILDGKVLPKPKTPWS
ncbi:DUF427-domain-containing protein [Durotheca rogersii]|uniref:DUF427-domain-containing protein n=1 Tax=Durotheca rogersii TaxID=419775 RepID=UPI0022208C67|nr:DUF427-domain-containing protein [Durotheca rogersii]KAI5863670.1 DUF427-domain-containing protein [Durotheca rogersii]